MENLKTNKTIYKQIIDIYFGNDYQDCVKG